ncbi:hypothetical protein AV530_003484 [Patagioenas fasciata monilis]|uniref:Uncharacterized protein n=1 Tax=Patagioenas fasciata monilis TaxID=372326 RepID=A0A1V4K2M5_PATFA|nr:hypothetical protein AV530_003484 [Patagioenas fasciata monilis]
MQGWGGDGRLGWSVASRDPKYLRHPHSLVNKKPPWQARPRCSLRDEAAEGAGEENCIIAELISGTELVCIRSLLTTSRYYVGELL